MQNYFQNTIERISNVCSLQHLIKKIISKVSSCDTYLHSARFQSSGVHCEHVQHSGFLYEHTHLPFLTATFLVSNLSFMFYYYVTLKLCEQIIFDMLKV